MALLDLMLRYNKLLPRVVKGGQYMDNPAISDTEKERCRPELRKISDELSSIINQIDAYKMTPNEIMKGFDIRDGNKSEL